MKISRYINGIWQDADKDLAREHFVRITINGQQLVTLTSSPHQMNFLVTGFLYLQGLISGTDDILSLGVCEQSGLAEVQLKEFTSPPTTRVLTSGCGTGISFSRPDTFLAQASQEQKASHLITPENIFMLMKSLNESTGRYHEHGGIHSAAVGEADQILLFAEDIGRHNALDRLAGEALMKGLSLRGKSLVTSGRVSSEMVVKAALLGIDVIASRTSPTDLAVKLCSEQEITLIGYVRGTSFDIYCCPERLSRTQAN